MIYALIGCLVIIGFLGFKLSKKVKIDNSRLDKYNSELALRREQIETQRNILMRQQADLYELEQSIKNAKSATEYEQEKLKDCRKELQDTLVVYNELVDKRMKEIEEIVEEAGKRRMEQLEETLHETKSKYDLLLKEYQVQRQKQADDIREQCIESETKNLEECKRIQEETDALRAQYEALLEPIKQYLKDQQEKYFYTIQLPEEYQDDIEFLLTAVAAKVQHPDIISKLVWTEYVKPNLDNTFKRIEAKSEPGIYKLTSLQNGMCYIGKSTDVKKRIADHFKSTIGIKSIADQSVHHAILKEGFWNWSIEVITYCDKERLNELEKYYIDFFKSQEFGYNRTAGG